MTIKQLRQLAPGTKVRWNREGEPQVNGRLRVAEPRNKNSARWIEWPDGQRTEDYDDWALVHVCVETARDA